MIRSVNTFLITCERCGSQATVVLFAPTKHCADDAHVEQKLKELGWSIEGVMGSRGYWTHNNHTCPECSTKDE